jgi:hypothetical protein
VTACSVARQRCPRSSCAQRPKQKKEKGEGGWEREPSEWEKGRQNDRTGVVAGRGGERGDQMAGSSPLGGGSLRGGLGRAPGEAIQYAGRLDGM